MKEVELTQNQIYDEVRKIMHFESEQLIQWVVKNLSEGYSVVIDAVGYIGNGHWVDRNKKKRYQYKMIVPILTDNGELYSTDLFESPSKNAINGHYALYLHTRQMAVGMVGVVDTDYNQNRFAFGYADGKYGFNKLKSL